MPVGTSCCARNPSKTNTFIFVSDRQIFKRLKVFFFSFVITEGGRVLQKKRNTKRESVKNPRAFKGKRENVPAFGVLLVNTTASVFSS